MGLTDDGNAYFKGEIHAQEGGTIAGWNISEDAIYKDNVALCTGNEEMDSLITENTKSNVRFKVSSGERLVTLTSGEKYSSGAVVYLYSQKCSEYGSLIEYYGGISAEGYTSTGSSLGPLLENEAWFATNKKVYYDKTKEMYCIEFNLALGAADYLSDFFSQIIVKNNPVAILEDGSLYAQAADITGNITTTKGFIGNCEITEEGLKLDESAKISVGEAILYVNEYNDTYLRGSNRLILSGTGGASIVIRGNGYSSSQTHYYRMGLNIAGNGNTLFQLEDYVGYSGFEGELLTVTLKYGGKIYQQFSFDMGSKTSYSKTFATPGESYLDWTIELSNYGDKKEFSIGRTFPSVWSSGGFTFVSKSKDLLTVDINNNLSVKGDIEYLGGLSKGSDRRIKNSIQNITEKYDEFYDLISPKLYRLNQGTSGRIHSGFIAQEVETALSLAGIDTKDFAGICIEQNTEAPMSIRYDEFIAINTWQIQKLKARVKQAEETIELQDTYIKKLEKRIEKLEQKFN